MSRISKLREFALKSGNIIAPLVWLLPDSLHYGTQYLRVKNSLKANLEERRDLQNQLFRESMERAARTPYYRKIFESKDAKNSPMSLSDIPVTTRSQLNEFHDQMVSGTNQSEVELVSTSGSSGVPVSFWLDRNRKPTEWAFLNHEWSKVGYRPRKWRVVFRGYSKLAKGTFEVNHLQREVRVSAGRGYDEQLFAKVFELQRKLQVQFLSGYPSSLSLYARYCKKMSAQLPVKAVIFVSEPLLKSDLDQISSVWPAAGFSAHYGLSEKCAFARCVDLNDGVYEFEPSYGLVEILDESDKWVSPGTRGRVIATRLQFQESSLLRYETGDTAIYLGGNTFDVESPLRVKDIMPRREAEFLECKFGCEHPVSTLIQTQSDFFSKRVMEYCFDNKNAGIAKFLFTAHGEVSIMEISAFEQELVRKLGPHFEVSVVQSQALPKAASGKRKLVLR